MFVKLLEIKTAIKENDFNYKGISEEDRTRMVKLYAKFDYVEFQDADGNSGMFCVIHDNYIADLYKLINDLFSDFNSRDLTNDVLFGNIPNVDGFTFDNGQEGFDKFIETFLADNLTADIVLDKILEYGRESLTDIDIAILEK